jgi:hypothetical protein
MFHELFTTSGVGGGRVAVRVEQPLEATVDRGRGGDAPYLGGHSTQARRTVVGQLPEVPVPEQVRVVGAPLAVGRHRAGRVERWRGEQHIARLTRSHVEGVRQVRGVHPGGRAAQHRVLADDLHRDAGKLHRVLQVPEVRQPQQHPVAGVDLYQRRHRLELQ